MDQDKVLHSPFDVETHKKTFVYYLEVNISPEGVIEYAVPSHQMFLENKLREKGIEPIDACPKEYYFDYHTWLCNETGYIMVWGIPHTTIKGTPNQKQQEALDMLRREGLI